MNHSGTSTTHLYCKIGKRELTQSALMIEASPISPFTDGQIRIGGQIGSPRTVLIARAN